MPNDNEENIQFTPEEMLGLTLDASRTNEKSQVIDAEPECLNLIPKEDLSSFLEKKRITPEKGRVVYLPKKGRLIVSADLHGCYADFKEISDVFIKDALNDEKEGTQTYLVFLGDYIHALDNLVLDEEKGIYAPNGLAYPDDSIKVISEILKLRQIFGDRVIPLIGDHELVIISPGFPMAKGNRNLTREISDKLNAEENDYLKSEVSDFPLLAITPNGYALSHSCPPKIKSISNIENANLECKIDFNSKDADKKILAWINNTAAGRLLWGQVLPNLIKVEHAETERKFSEDEMIDYLEKIKCRKAIIGHIGISDSMHEEDGILIPMYGVDGIEKDRKYIAAVGTAECRGANKKRSNDGKGPNTYGGYCRIELDEKFGTIEYCRFGEDDRRIIRLKTDEFRLAAKEPPKETLEDKLSGLKNEIKQQVKAVAERGGLNESLYKGFLSNFDEFAKDSEREELEKIHEFFTKTNISVSPLLRKYISDAAYLGKIPQEWHKLFKKDKKQA